MNTYKILSASCVTMKQVKAAFIKNASVEKDFWWATPNGALFAPQKGSIESVLHKTLMELGLPSSAFTYADVFAWGYEASCRCSIVLEEVRGQAAERSEMQARMFHEMGRRNDMHRYSLL